MNIKEIQSLIKFVAKSGASEVKLETDDLKITIKTGSSTPETTIIQAPPQVAQVPISSGIPIAQASNETPLKSEAKVDDKQEDDDSKYITIKSPIIGTFYRRPSPDKPMFAEVGTVVKEGDTVCIIEAMKLFNEIESEVSGKIVKVLIEDSTPVEFDQPLFLVDPS